MSSKQVYICPQCGAKFLQYPSQVGGKAFCSKACYSESMRDKAPHNKGRRTVISKPCLVCKSPIEGMPSEVNRRKFCSKACASAALAGDLKSSLARYRVVGECWLWDGATRGGYGRLKLAGVGTVEAHRASYEFHIGPIPSDLVLDHLCRNRGCINPAHLEPVTTAENIRRGLQGSPEAMRKHWETRRKGKDNDTNCGNRSGGEW